ncbi:MAG: DNA-protecting protein DprA [Alcanivorax sp.]|jgi:DNA processing protein|uniref:DNA-processing protein DprA n=1 Tax=Alcanivorax TaxID=59753 RepID=UPI000C59B042|nr:MULTISPECIES: DNA-processing protein DprA [Alcanivorax]MAC14561.1 DNA-protecting protein DprA [Alcanivorax sp.]MBG32187.1 DNA-protecting protein DprA [Alcanivorax sp.]MDF1637284.1 DNA-processing protein DprA [Alcanivorax jadensis]|tara:strand:+ start:129 stop:1190 length:1062 start_codon:yes stop_codon:yes gene_type:complete
MDGQYKRLLLQALFSPSSAALGRALKQQSIDRTALADYLPLLPAGLKERRKLLDHTGSLTVHYEHLREQGWRWLALGDADYPSLLAQLGDAPGVLAVRGSVAALNAPGLAIVGARNASADGLDNSRRFARDLAGSGFVIVSGLALGVDAAAHRGAISSGRTVAVLGSGPDRIYPPRNAVLAGQIVESGGALVTEFAPGAPPLPAQFPQRNRVISGLSLGTIVVEAAIKSGSLITARTALAQGREVFAIPGSIHNPLSKGCHQLLRDGASWLESREDIFHAFGDFRRSVEAVGINEPDLPDLLQHLTGGLNSLDVLQERTGLPITDLAGQLSELELEGWVERVAGGYLKRSGAT